MTAKADQNEMRTAAIGYLHRGWSVIPVRPGEKRPLVRWEEYQHRRASEDEVRGWFAAWPRANIGIVTGPISELVVIDVDPAHGGAESLSALESAHGNLPQTIEAITGGGGRHLYFADEQGAIGNRVGITGGVDIRGTGGYVVAPPSLHPSGRRYAWKPSCGPDERPLATLPRWFAYLAGAEHEQRGHSRGFWRQLVRDGVVEGSRNNSIAQLAGHLLWHEVDPAIVLDLLLCWNSRRCRPPLPDDEVAGVVDSISRLHRRRPAAADRGDANPGGKDQ
ncbi:MAG TPA: bifunctional DNA primase/polymerase [Candidatus Cybelea sp.]|nr:bifunctional DNA primase/polymerase [Candidatus Cybelea sp.]